MRRAIHRTIANPYSEHEVQTQCNNYLRLKGWYCERLNAGQYPIGAGASRRYVMGVAKGTPDALAFRLHPSGDGVRLWFIEYKRAGNKPTPLQAEKMAELEDFGALCSVVHSLEECVEQEATLR